MNTYFVLFIIAFITLYFIKDFILFLIIVSSLFLLLKKIDF